jgi:hypothetical protein
MIARRLALFFAMIFGVSMTQVPEFVEQYKQRLGGAIDELAVVVARFDSDSKAQGLSEKGGIDRLNANPDVFVRQRGKQMAEVSARLDRLRETQEALNREGPVGRITTIVTHYDPGMARRAFDAFQPAVPVSAESFVLGVLGFIFGGGFVHIAVHPLGRGKRRPRRHTIDGDREMV